LVGWLVACLLAWMFGLVRLVGLVGLDDLVR